MTYYILPQTISFSTLMAESPSAALQICGRTFLDSSPPAKTDAAFPPSLGLSSFLHLPPLLSGKWVNLWRASAALIAPSWQLFPSRLKKCMGKRGPNANIPRSLARREQR